MLVSSAMFYSAFYLQVKSAVTSIKLNCNEIVIQDAVFQG
jgi:hypothetical protein